MKKILFIVAISLVFSFGLIYASGTAEQGSGENNSPNSNSSNNSNGTSVQENVPNLETLEGTNAKPIDETVLACMAAKNSFDNALQLNDLIEASNVFVATASRKNIDDLEKFPEIEQTINQMKQDFENALQNISFEVISKPATPVKGKAFNKPFAVKVLNNNNAMPNVKLSVSFPVITSDGTKSTETKIIESNAEGVVSFESPIYNSTINSFVTFTLNLNSELGNLINLPSEKIPFKVMTNMRASGGSIAIVDFSKADKAITNNSESSSALLTALINRGFTSIGNCDFTSEVTSGSDAKVQKAAQELFSGSVTYLVYGTIKYVSVEKVSAGYKIILKTDVKVRNVKLNRELLACNFETESTAKSEWQALNNCRKNIAEQLADAIMFGM